MVLGSEPIYEGNKVIKMLSIENITLNFISLIKSAACVMS